MNKITYKPSILKSLISIIQGIIAALFIYVILSVLIKNSIIPILISLVIILGFIFIIFSESKLLIEINGDNLYIKYEKKEYNFKISECSFNYFVSNNKDFYIYITSNNNEELSIDCSLLFRSQFNNLLHDLKIVGEGAKVNYLKTNKRG